MSPEDDIRIEEEGNYYSAVFRDEADLEDIRRYSIAGNPSSPSIGSQLSQNSSSPSVESSVSDNTSSPTVSERASDNDSSPATGEDMQDRTSGEEFVGELRMGRDEENNWRVQSVRTGRDEGRETAREFAENITEELER